MKLTRLLTCLLTATTLLFASLPAQSGMVGTAQLQSSAVANATAKPTGQREWIVEQLRLGGVEKSRAVERVASLTDSEVAQIYQRLDEIPAGGSGTELVLIGIIAFLVLELMGVIDVIPDN